MAEQQNMASRKLTPEELKRVLEWAKSQGTGGRGCSFCGTNHWATYGDIVELRPYSGKGLVIGGVVIPAILLICDKCGHLELLSALASGIVKPGEVNMGQVEQKTEAKKANG